MAQSYYRNFLGTNKFGVYLGLSSKERMLDGLFLAFDEGFEDIQARVFWANLKNELVLDFFSYIQQPKLECVQALEEAKPV